MDEIVQRYKQGKFQKCLELIKLLPERFDTVDNFVQENNYLVCQSIISTLENDIDKMFEAQEQLYLFFDKVTSIDMITNSIPFELKLTALFNFIFWILFFNNGELSEGEKEEYLELVNKGMLKVLEKESSLSISSTTSEKIISNLYRFKSLVPNENTKTVFLILELTTIVILYVVKLDRIVIKKCVRLLSDVVDGMKQTVSMVESMNSFLEVQQTPLCMFKFGLNKTGTVLSELSSDSVDYLYLLETTLLHLMGEFKESLKSLQKNMINSNKNLWCYLGAVNSLELQHWDLCLGFLTKASSLVLGNNLKARFCIMHGKLCHIKRDHKGALKHFEDALSFSPHCPEVYYYMGQQYGKMGIIDLMLESFEKFVRHVGCQDVEDRLLPNFESTILEWIHSSDEVTETEALYSLAVAYGLNERFQKATETYEKILQQPDFDTTNSTAGIIQMPHHLTILHEASIMNLQTGNLVRAEQIALDAAERFLPQEPPKKSEQRQSLLNIDVGWLEMVIHRELLETNLEPKELKQQVLYPEDVVFGFPQDVLALLIISEIQRIQEMEEYKATLSKILSTFSTYLASMYKKKVVSEDENYVWTLVKALAGKTCLRIATVLMKYKDGPNVDKMLKRALSCNKGDKDALHSYYTYLLKAGKRREALKLWHTFYKEEATVTVDDVQSFALRYFLVGKVTKHELERIQSEITFMNVELS